ncbi:hypothetical protein V6S02_06000 [Microbacterium sp. CCNWLW134]|uniref:hypothetical protein n=1 Tax=Microbacterium sp. CCNWLW134 TaxID=3122064 RepID=UPI00300FB213
MAENSNHIDRAHPVRVLLDNAAHGNVATPNDLNHLLGDVSDERLPEGHSLLRYRETINTHAARIAKMHATGNYQAAREAAAAAAAELAGRMTPEQRALKTHSTRSDQADIDSMVARLFTN